MYGGRRGNFSPGLRPIRYVIQTGFHDQGVSRADLQPSGAHPSPGWLTTADIHLKNVARLGPEHVVVELILEPFRPGR